MKEFSHPLGTIKIPDQNDSLDDLYRLRQTRGTWAADTETTSLGIYLPNYRVRLVQVGTGNEAWVLRPEWHGQAIHDLTKAATWFNLPFDALSMEQSIGIDYHVTAKDAEDGEIYSRILDPRGPEHGGLGHKLKDLADYHVLPGVKDARNEVVAAGRQYKIKANEIWEKIPIDDPTYLYYAGQDVLLTARTTDVLRQKVHERDLERFYVFETELANTVVEMQRYGTLVDKVWATENRDYYLGLMEEFEDKLRNHWGIEQTATFAHTSKKSLMNRFEQMGVRWAKFSAKTNQPSLDREVLQTFAKGHNEIAELAADILKAKKSKHYADYLIGVLAYTGIDGRIHPNIQPLRAATARMSIGSPPVQQWPSHDPDTAFRIRGSLIADYGHVLISCDLKQVEFRVSAAVSGDTAMKAAIIANDVDPDTAPDLHERTAMILYPRYYEYKYSDDADRRKQAKLWRALVKPAGFGRLYLGGAKTIHAQAEMMGMEITMDLVKKSIRAFDKAWPQTIAWGRRVIERAENDPVIYTATGRPLIVDRPYAAVNYLIQSPARDIFASGILRLHEAGLGQYLRLVVHDEVVLSVPEKDAKALIPEIKAAMETKFKGVPILSDAEIKGKHWNK